MPSNLPGRIVLAIGACLLLTSVAFGRDADRIANIVNDVTQLNPIEVAEVIIPTRVEEIQTAVRNHPGPIAIGGGRFSMGGQTATERALHIDMRRFNQILAFSPTEKTITVQPGITWREIQAHIDPHDLSLKIMQTYANFTVGGSLSVNVHGRYVGQGPLVLSVRSLRLVLADGSIVACSPTERPELFYAAIGGYGGIGVIVETTLDLADNVRVKRDARKLPASEYAQHFAREVRNDTTAIFHNGDLYPPNYNTVMAVTWRRTDEPVTVPDRLIPVSDTYTWQPQIIDVLSDLPVGRQFVREYLIDPLVYSDERIEWRNYEASYDVAELEPASRTQSTYVLQEYFVPVAQFDAFVPKMAQVFREHDANIINVSIRHAHADPGTLLAWARQEVFAFVVYYKQAVSDEERAKVGEWTRAMIDTALSVGGSYYLPYQIHATPAQFHRAYPRADEYFAVKAAVDPTGKFRNKLIDSYYPGSYEELIRTREGITAYRRPEVRTYLTVPEWYLVFNPEEYADYIGKHPPSGFPYFSGIGEFWRLYAKTNDLANDEHEVDGGTHLMLMVIGTSFTVEQAVKGLYENTIGRLTEWTSTDTLTEEDRLIQRYQAEYAAFIHTYPWYDFPFYSKLKEFHEHSKLNEDNRLREIERSLAFSVGFGFKSLYAWFIRAGTKTVYDEDEGNIYAMVENLPSDATTWDSRLKIVQRLKDGRALISIPRYDPFRDVSVALAKHGVRFTEIAGNDEILTTFIGPADWKNDFGFGRVVFTSRILTDDTRQRFGIVTRAPDFGRLLADLSENHGVKLEHVYDY